jgi:aspartate/methionine/tyrosine aminotransferase
MTDSLWPALLFAFSTAWPAFYRFVSSTSPLGKILRAFDSERSDSTVSQRGQNFLSKMHPYLLANIAAFQNLYNSKTNPGGMIPLAIAENKLMHHELIVKLQSYRASSSTVLEYTAAKGSATLREELAKFFTDYILSPIPSKVLKNQIVVGSGCTGILYALSYILFSENESVLIPTPYYPVFDKDFMNLGNVQCVEVNGMHQHGQISSQLTEEALEEAYERSLRVFQKRPKALLLTNPSNPCGTINSESSIRAAIEFADRYKLHIISDEIYALSLFDLSFPHKKFRSIASVMENRLGDRVHILWAMSKDFGASGLRLGVLYSHNSELLRAISRYSPIIYLFIYSINIYPSSNSGFFFLRGEYTVS